MPVARRRPASVTGFTLFELVLVIVIISILVAVALDRLLPYIDEAERVAVLRVEGQLRSMLMMEAAERIVRGESASVVALAGANPVKFLLEPPKNYLGELDARRAREAAPRHWYFDQSSARLVYRLGEPYARPATEPRPENPTFAVSVDFDDRDGSGTFDAGRDELHGVRLLRVAGGEWLRGDVSR